MAFECICRKPPFPSIGCGPGARDGPFMPAIQCGPRIEEIARRWHDLAERRLNYYNELYRSGRWTRYYPNQEQFAARMLDVIKAAKAFGRLAGDPPAIPALPDDLRSAA